MYAPVYNWTGLYLGINGGWGWADTNLGNADGGLIGGTIGYNWQAPGSPWVFGLEGDIAYSDIGGNAVRNEWLGTARGRLGWAFDRVMPYITGGLAVGEVRATPFGFAGASSTNAGWTIGAGVEGAIAGNFTAKLEYLYVDLGNVNCSVFTCGVASNVDFTAHVLRAGLNYKF